MCVWMEHHSSHPKRFHAEDMFNAICKSKVIAPMCTTHDVHVVDPAKYTLSVSNREDLLFVSFHDLTKGPLHGNRERYICITFSKATHIIAQVLADVYNHFGSEGFGPGGSMGEIDELPECIFAKKKDTATFQVEIAPNGENIEVCVAGRSWNVLLPQRCMRFIIWHTYRLDTTRDYCLFIQNWLLVNAIMGLAPSLHLKAIPPLVSSILQLDAFLLISIGSGWLHELGTRGRGKLGHRAELATRANGFLVEVHCVVFVVGFCSRLFCSQLLWARDFSRKWILHENRFLHENIFKIAFVINPKK